MSTISPNQRRAALMNSSTAKKAMRLAAMLATSPTEVAAPLLAASRTFRSSLCGKRPQWAHVAGHPLWKVSSDSVDVCIPRALPITSHPRCPLVPANCPYGFPALAGCMQPHSTIPHLTLTPWRCGCLLCP